MEKIEASKLLIKILTNACPPTTLILADETIFQKCAEDALTQKNKKRPKVFEGAQALAQYNQSIRQNSLFEPVSDALVFLDENFSTKKGDEENKIAVENKESNVFFFGKTGLRHSIQEKNFPAAISYLCYSPNNSERYKCAEILVKNFLAPHKESISEMAEQALIHYNNDLYHCALHFERMQKSGLSFKDAKLSDSSLSGFDIVQTLLEEDLSLLDMRLQQFANHGEDASSVFRALVYFFKQLSSVHAELAKNLPLSQALSNAKIPYPAQDKIKKALQIIPYNKIEHFFSVCAQIEIDLRERKNSHQILFLELSYFLPK